MTRRTFAVLCLIAQQEASYAAWEAFLCDRPMTWLVGTPAPVAPVVRKSRRFKFSRQQGAQQ